MKTTIYDVAREAGVSITTVSKVINNTGKISEKTKKKVFKSMEQLNYVPSQVATALTGKKTDTIGLLVPDVSNPFYAAMVRQIEDEAHLRGMSVIVCSTDYDSEKESKYVELLKRKQVDGFIVSSGFSKVELLDQLIEDGIPIIMLAQDNPDKINAVSVDDFKGGYLATSHLLSYGHRNIAIISEQVMSGDLRIYGYRAAHDERKIPINEENIFKTRASLENGKRLVKKLFEKGNNPTAVFACNDLLAVGVIQGAREMGKRIPEDLSVIGFDDTILATITVPGLTTVSQPIGDMARKTLETLVRQIKGEYEGVERTLFMPTLVVRGTTSRLT